MPDDQDVDQQLDALTERIQSLREKCLSRSAYRVAKELRSLAKSERRVVPYLIANFYLMNDAQSLFEPEFGADVAIESIALLESEEQARQFQPDLPEDHYGHTVHWMSACSYDNLAKHVAEREGYNSDGVHDCINDGMQVCRRTGKLECLTCFREYATDVYRASDDIEMALHHARYVSQHHDPDTNNDRRWVGSKDVTHLLLLSGNLEAAEEAARHAGDMIETYHNPLSARRDLRRLLETIHWMSGRQDALQASLADHDLTRGLEPLPAGESPVDECQDAMREAVVLACRGEFVPAIEKLSQWDRSLRERQCLDHWFEVRLRLIGLQLLQGDRAKAESLGRQLADRAKPARDYLSLRRLKGLLEGTVKPSPLACVATASSGPFGDASTTVRVAGVASAPVEDAATGPVAATEAVEPPPTPLAGFIAELRSQMESAGVEPDSLNPILDRILAVDPATIAEGEDAGWLLFLGHILGRMTERIGDVWGWGSRLVQKFPQHPGVLNLTADLGDSVRGTCDDAEEADRFVTTETIESWFRQSLDLDPNRPNNYARAGTYFLNSDQIGDAERCFARAFRLDRGNARIALGLAEIYAGSERPRDALSVLDMCIREGADDPPLFWQAGLTAMSCERWEAVVTYLDRFDELSPGEPWTHYYRALALLENGRPAEALAALQLEAERNPECPFPVAALRGWGYSQLGQADPLREQLGQLLSLRLAEADYLTYSGLNRLFEKLYAAAQILPDDDPHRQKLETLILQTGMAPEALFEAARTGELDEVNFYVCQLVQDLGPDWPQFPGCLAGQDGWTNYEARWGVLAANEEAAADEALRWQRRAYPAAPARVAEVAEQGGPYTDAPGIVWQAMHQPE